MTNRDRVRLQLQRAGRRGATARQIAAALRWDVAYVTPHLTELHDDGCIAVLLRERNPATGRPVKRWVLVEHLPDDWQPERLESRHIRRRRRDDRVETIVRLRTENMILRRMLRRAQRPKKAKQRNSDDSQT